MGGWWAESVVDAGKLPLLLCLTAFVLTFVLTRSITRMIRAGVGPFRNNVSESGVHIHHAVPGIILLIIGALMALAAEGPPWVEIAALTIGVGMSLILDEFALILHLQDVYWTAEGRTSVDAVFVGVALTGLLLLGAAPFGVNNLSASEEGGGWAVTVSVLLNAVFVVITFAKGKVWTGLVGLLVPVFALVGTIRAARPSSLWARRFYGADTYRMHRALHREAGFRRRVTRARTALSDTVAGKPDA